VDFRGAPDLISFHFLSITVIACGCCTFSLSIKLCTLNSFASRGNEGHANWCGFS